MQTETVSTNSLTAPSGEQTLDGTHTRGTTSYDWNSGDGFVTTSDISNLANDPVALGQYDPGYITINPGVDFILGTSDFTIEAWVRLSDTPYTRSTIMSQQLTISSEQSFNYFYEPGSKRFKLNFNNSAKTIQSDPTSGLAPDTWYHVAVVRYTNNDTTTTTFYLDGTPVGPSGYSTVDDIQYSAQPVYIGASNDGGTSSPVKYPWIGYMQDIRLMKQAAYDGTFTPDEPLVSAGGGSALGDPHIVTLGGVKYTL